MERSADRTYRVGRDVGCRRLAKWYWRLDRSPKAFASGCVRETPTSAAATLDVRVRARSCTHRHLSGVSTTMPSSPPPLLGASPLRTGLESFPSSGSSTRERPLEKRGRSRMQKSHTTYAILRGGRFTLPRNDPRQCGRLHQRFAPPSFAIASFVGSTTGLAFEHQREVGSVSGEVTQPLSAPLQGGLRFLPIPLPASPWSALRLSTSPEERYGLTLFRWTDAIV